MAKGQSQFIGTAGEYYVAYCLTTRRFHATITLGNAPDVDIMVASEGGSSLLSLQVKTRWSGCRCRWYKREVWQWDVGAGAVGRHSPNLWYAFVDLKESVDEKPDVFLVPSLWVSHIVGADWSRKIFPLKIECEPLCKERWDWIQKFFDGDEDAKSWATTVPKEARL